MIVDANVLLYAVDDQSHFHATARTWLDDAMNGVERVGLPWVSLMAFQRITTEWCWGYAWTRPGLDLRRVRCSISRCSPLSRNQPNCVFMSKAR